MHKIIAVLENECVKMCVRDDGMLLSEECLVSHAEERPAGTLVLQDLPAMTQPEWERRRDHIDAAWKRFNEMRQPRPPQEDQGDNDDA